MQIGNDLSCWQRLQPAAILYTTLSVFFPYIPFFGGGRKILFNGARTPLGDPADYVILHSQPEYGENVTKRNENLFKLSGYHYVLYCSPIC